MERTKLVVSKRPVRLVEKYRPHKVEDFVEHSKIKAVLSKFVRDPYPAAFLFSGSSGTGKTSIAQAMAEHIGTQVWHLGSHQCNFEALENLCGNCESAPIIHLLSGGMSALYFVIIDEVDQ
jgi:DNA polymerase III gamma/tau subunit